MSSDPELQTAMRLHQTGRLAEAQIAYDQILAHRPSHPEALHLLGLIAHQRGDTRRGIVLIEQAVALSPDNPEFLSNLGELLRRSGNLPAAIATFQKALAAGAKSLHTWHNLALACKDHGQLLESIAAFRHVIAAKPDYAEAHCNLGSALFDNHQPQEAIAVFRAALAIKPSFPQALKNLGTALRATGSPDQAAAAFRQAIALAPGDAAAHRDLSLCLLASGKTPEAVDAARDAVRLGPLSGDTHRALGLALADAGNIPEAAASYHEALRLRPDSPVWRFEFAAITGDGSMPTPPQEYVRNLFDAYAPHFDTHLVDKLDYHVPEQLRDLVLSVEPARKYDILDLGCGTGLVGLHFRPHARRLVGVDLAREMVRQAAARAIYDELLTADILDVLKARPGQCDLILAADVFIYVGDLAKIFPAAAACLRPGGLLAFSIEHFDGPGFILHRRRRYAHALAYIGQLAAAHGFTEVATRDVIIRKDPPIPTAGHLLILRSSSEAGQISRTWACRKQLTR